MSGEADMSSDLLPRFDSRSESTNPLVSIIIPVFDRVGVLPRAVESVLRQTWRDWELVICDDASRDDTAEIARTFAERDRRIHLLRQEENLGAAVARNTAMESAKGKYVAFLDSDDEWMPEKLARQVQVMEGLPDGVGICFTGARYLINDCRWTDVIPKREWETDTLEQFVDGTIAYTTSSILFRRICLETVGGMTPALRRGQDDDWLVRFFMHYGLVTMPEALVVMHLCTLHKRTYSHTVAKADYMIASYYDTIERRCGRRCAALFKGKLLMEVATRAFMEHRWGAGLRYVAMAQRGCPLQRRPVYLRLFRSFLHGLWHWE